MRLWFPTGVIIIYWLVYAAVGLRDASVLEISFNRMFAILPAVLLLTGWWLSRKAVSWRERLLVPVITIAALVTCIVVNQDWLLAMTVTTNAAPLLLTAWVLWVWYTRTKPAGLRFMGLVIMGCLAFLPMFALRSQGMKGTGEADLYWRWEQSREEKYRALALKNGAATMPAGELTLGPDGSDWPAFRGTDRDGVMHGVKIATNWNEAPPKRLWKRPIGPGWPSITVIGDHLFTLEQQDVQEVVLCLDAKTGQVIWSHEESARFDESMGGPGPRATPTFADGKIYTLGATGILICFDAASGRVIWKRKVAEDTGNEVPIWGLSSSPLVVQGVVVVFAGGESSEKNLVAYHAETGKPAWTADTGGISYASPQLAMIAGKEQILYLTASEFAGFDTATGSKLWGYSPAYTARQPPVSQPMWANPMRAARAPATAAGEAANEPGENPASYLVNFTQDQGTAKIEVKFEAGKWSAAEKWTSRDLKPYYNDAVRLGDYLYGYDGDLFTCLEVATGKRMWKKGRYGMGQVLALADQPLLLVMTETGEAVLISPDPKDLKELGRFQALEGKTWNHPVIAGGKLFVRNSQEIACYQLQLLP